MSAGDYKIFDRYRVGSEVGLSNSLTWNNISDDKCKILLSKEPNIYITK